MLTLAELKKIVALNGGATLTHKGEIAALDHGYMVSLSGCEYVTTLDALDERTYKAYCRMARKKKAYFGLWLDGDALYLDMSIRVGDKIAARKIGKKNEQIAIFDLSKKESIYLN